MNTTNSKRWLPRRNTVITGAAFGAVVLAGAAAVGLNVGILNAADDDKVGDLAAAGDLVPAATQVVDVYLDDPTAPSTAVAGSTADDPHQFVVDAAGTASVISTAGGLRLGDVATNPGWSWSPVDADVSTVKLWFTNGARTLVFTTTLEPDGSLGALVEEPTASPAVANPAIDSDDDVDDESDDHESEDDDHEDEEHEGRDDDD